MSFIQNFFTSRDNNANAATYVGQQDRLWWNPDNNALYVSNGNTAGGIPVTIGPGANANLNVLTVNTISVNTAITSTGGNVNVTGNLVISGNISPASNVKIGGVRAGPGANISNTGLLTIDTTGLPLSFGNFTANNNILTIVNVNEDMILETQGNAEIQLVGNVGFYKPNGGGAPDPEAVFFFARDDGQITILVPAEDPLLGAVEIIGSSTGNLISPGQPGAMLHITGNPGTPARLYLDGNGEYASFVARRYNGNVAVPTQVLAGEDVFRINATAATTSGVGNVSMAQIKFTALENQTPTAQGSNIQFLVTPVGQPATSRIDVANISVANGVQATQFTTAGNVSATGNVTGGNISTTGLVTATGNVTGGNITTAGLITAIGNITGGNISATNHTGTTVSVTGNVTGGNLVTGGLITATGNITGGNIVTAGVITATGNITGGNVSATNYTGRVTHGIRDAGDVDGGTVTLNMTTDDIVKCTFGPNGMTVAFSNIIPGRVVTLLAEKTDGTTDNIATGIASTNMSNGDNTSPVNGPCTAVLTYYSLGTTTTDIYCQIVSAV